MERKRRTELPSIYREALGKYFKLQKYLSMNDRADLYNRPEAQELLRAGKLILEHIHEGLPLEDIRKKLVAKKD